MFLKDNSLQVREGLQAQRQSADILYFPVARVRAVKVETRKDHAPPFAFALGVAVIISVPFWIAIAFLLR